MFISYFFSQRREDAKFFYFSWLFSRKGAKTQSFFIHLPFFSQRREDAKGFYFNLLCAFARDC